LVSIGNVSRVPSFVVHTRTYFAFVVLKIMHTISAALKLNPSKMIMMAMNFVVFIVAFTGVFVGLSLYGRAVRIVMGAKATSLTAYRAVSYVYTVAETGRQRHRHVHGCDVCVTVTTSTDLTNDQL